MYEFRGQLISGFHAYALLKAILMVNNEAPNPTPEDIKLLTQIVADFDVKFTESLRDDLKEDQSEDE